MPQRTTLSDDILDSHEIRAPLGQHDVLLVRDHGFQHSPAIERYAKTLDEHGYRVIAFGWDREAKLAPLEKRPHFDIQRVHFFRAPSRSWRVLLGIAIWQFRLFWRVLFAHEHLIHACDFHSGPACRLATLLNRKPFIYDMRDPISAAFKLGGLGRLLYHLEHFFTNISDLVIIPGENRLEYVGAKARDAKTLVLYNSPVDRPDLYDLIYRDLPERFTVSNPLRINVCGHIHAGRGIYELLELVSRCEAVALDVVGDPRNDVLLEQIRETPRVRYFEPVPNARSQELMAESHVVAALYDPEIEINRLACSNKTYEAMMLGRPLLTNTGINIGELALREHVGLVVRFGDIDSLKSGISPLLAHPEPLAQMGRRARDLFERNYGWQKQATHYVDAIKNMLGNTNKELS